MTERRRTTRLEDFRAPGNAFRVIAWHQTVEGHEIYIEGDFADRAEARRKVDELRAAGAYSACIYDCIGRRSFTRSERVKNADVPISVTRLCGLADLFKRTGSYKRR